AASAPVPADGKVHALQWRVPVARSSWVGPPQFPELHTNPVNVFVGDKPIRVSRRRARRCIATIEHLRGRARNSRREPARAAARQACDEAVQKFRSLAAEAPEGS